MGETIAFANQKGGVGKTTTVVSIAAFLALDGYRVLVVDIDPQGNATSGLGIDRTELDGSVYDVLLGDADVNAIIHRTGIDRVTVLPSDRSLAGAEVELVPRQGRERRLRQTLAPVVPDFDFILLDCPPSLGLLTVNGLTAADSVLIPLQCEYYALEGLSQLMATIDLVREHLNPGLALKGVVLTMYDARTTLSADVATEVRRTSVIGSSERSSRAASASPKHPASGARSRQHSPASRGAEAYRAITAELLVRSGRRPGPALTGHELVGAATAVDQEPIDAG